MVELLQMGVHGICSNDPRLFAEAERIVTGDAPSPEEGGGRQAKKAEKQTVKAEKQEAKAQKKASKKAAKAEG